ncbi:hypothetical protein [Aquimarina muelleri]|uniref:Uncharacterized protein n=1 Tax=Aquimarina muelleri TaxID=279356 RepID=A0A918JZ65_9FLAO|nr:hypothetical protein [Aquimarina muelleri]MCX2762415.1 hypothetical protein [Aquimarina muelleri]GGX24703.1 hypothetical protein GCM10007384_27190 [Aquimarina muelleri]
MNLYNSVFLFFFFSFSYSQELSQNEINISYESFLQAVEKKDTLVTEKFKRYKCSEFFSGSIKFYFLEKKLKLIIHRYKQGGDMNLEHYYVDKDTLRLQTSFLENIRYNTYSFESTHEKSSTIEKVLEVIEFRKFFGRDFNELCYERKDMQKLAEWNSDFFNSLSFKKKQCANGVVEDVNYKYRLLLKAEKKLVNYGGKKLGCIFHLW